MTRILNYQVSVIKTNCVSIGIIEIMCLLVIADSTCQLILVIGVTHIPNLSYVK